MANKNCQQWHFPIYLPSKKQVQHSLFGNIHSFKGEKNQPNLSRDSDICLFSMNEHSIRETNIFCNKTRRIRVPMRQSH